MISKTINIKTENQIDAFTIAAALETIAANVTKENILLLAEKSKKKGINEKLQSYKNLI